MGKSTKLTVSICAVLLVLGVLDGAVAQEFGGSDINRGEVYSKQVDSPLAPQSITQSLDPQTILEGWSVACDGPGCPTASTGWWRLFDLDADHGLVGQFCVESVDYGVEIAGGTNPQNITADVYCLNDGASFVLDNLLKAGTTTQPQPPGVGKFFNIEVGGCCISETQSMAVQLMSDFPSCLYIGMNDSGETAPSYISAPGCGVGNPIPIDFIGGGSFPNRHLVMVVNGTDETPVPAATGIGVTLMILTLLVTGFYFMRRRALG